LVQSLGLFFDFYKVAPALEHGFILLALIGSLRGELIAATGPRSKLLRQACLVPYISWTVRF